jgi:transcriptional regulator with XRE-family HTH domain
MRFDPEEFGWRIRVAIEEAGYTVSEAAHKMGVPHSRISEYCSGAITPPVKRIYEMVERLGLDIHTIFPANVIHHATTFEE